MNVGKSKTTIHLALTPAEKERIALQAESRNIGDSAFIRLIVLGAISRGGGTVEQLLMAGEEVQGSVIRRRGSTNYEKLWIRDGHRKYVSGDWLLVKNADAGQTGQKAKDDINKWWWLHHRESFVDPQPLCFGREEAMEKAFHIIERITNDAINSNGDSGTHLS